MCVCVCVCVCVYVCVCVCVCVFLFFFFSFFLFFKQHANQSIFFPSFFPRYLNLVRLIHVKQQESDNNKDTNLIAFGFFILENLFSIALGKSIF